MFSHLALAVVAFCLGQYVLGDAPLESHLERPFRERSQASLIGNVSHVSTSEDGVSDAGGFVSQMSLATSRLHKVVEPTFTWKDVIIPVPTHSINW